MPGAALTEPETDQGPFTLGCRGEAATALWCLPRVADATAYDQPTRWEDFRGSVLGPTDPKDAPAGALRGIVAADWEKLGLKAPCNGGDNAVHASASPFEGLAERTNWLGVAIADDPFGKVLLAAGLWLGLGLSFGLRLGLSLE